MSWVEVVWLVMAGASLALALIHLFVWFKRRKQYAYLLFFALAGSAAIFGTFELALMRAETPATYGDTLRWAHVPLAIVVLSIIGFVHFYLGAGKPWLAYTAIGFRLLALGLNFVTGVNVNFSSVTAVEHVMFWGGASVSAPVGIPSPWAVVPQIGNVLLLAFVADASIALWRRGAPADRRRAGLVGGSIMVFVGGAATFAALTVAGVVRAPTIVMPGVFLLVLAMGYELVRDVVSAADLAARLRSSEASFRAVVEAVPNALLLVNAGGRITLANAQGETVFGYVREELIGLPIESLIPASFRDAHEGHRHRYAGDARPGAMGAGRELYGLCKDGSEVPVEVALNPVQTVDGSFTLVSVVDVTERRRMELAMARQRNELAHLSRASMLGALSGSLAHELNQPLTAILSNAQAAERFLAQSPPRLDQVSEIIADIVKNDRRASAVIQRLRSMLRKEDAEYRLLDINEIVDESLRLMRSDLLNRRTEVTTDFAAALPRVSGDRVQLQQVVLNLVLNGCEAMDGEEADRRIVVRTRRTDRSNVEVSVADRGTGIRPNDIPKIFDSFVTTKKDGMGLGLAICRTIVEAHGGGMRVSNNADRGATMYFELPGQDRASGHA